MQQLIELEVRKNPVKMQRWKDFMSAHPDDDEIQKDVRC